MATKHSAEVPPLAQDSCDVTHKEKTWVRRTSLGREL